MIKKNKLSIFLFAVVAMLTVYYIKNPGDEEPAGDGVETVRYYQDERDSINEIRASLIVELEGIVSSSEVGIDEKEIAINKMSEINGLTESEIALENQIINMGYQDCLIQASLDNKSVNVDLIDSEVTKDEFIEISRIVSTRFSDYKMTLNYEAI